MKTQVKYRIWIISDLQQSAPEKTREFMQQVINDFKEINLKCDRIFCLGDTSAGDKMEDLKEMSLIQKELLASLDIPLRFVLGNHELDVYRNKKNKERIVPFYETVKQTPGWKTTKKIEDFYFKEELGDYNFIFLSDHSSENGSWFSTHGKVFGNKEEYPYSEQDFKNLSKQIKKDAKPTITLSHYSFAGGGRPSNLLNKMLPLPDNVCIHFHGHLHIGDKYHGQEKYLQKISYIDYQDIPQINAASLENVRGNAMRSVFLEIYEDNSLGVYFREHDNKRWVESYGKKVD